MICWFLTGGWINGKYRFICENGYVSHPNQSGTAQTVGRRVWKKWAHIDRRGQCFFQQSLNAGGFPFEVNENNAEIIKAKAMARLIKIIYKPQAVLDIRQTQEYIAQTLGNKKAAQKLVASILKAISLLEENPMMGISMEARFEKNFYTFFYSRQAFGFL